MLIVPVPVKVSSKVVPKLEGLSDTVNAPPTANVPDPTAKIRGLIIVFTAPPGLVPEEAVVKFDAKVRLYPLRSNVPDTKLLARFIVTASNRVRDP